MASSDYLAGFKAARAEDLEALQALVNEFVRRAAASDDDTVTSRYAARAVGVAAAMEAIDALTPEAPDGQ